MSSGVIKLLNKEDKELSKRTYYSTPMRKKIIKEWAEFYGDKFEGMFIHITPDFDDDLYDNNGKRITSLSKRLDFIKDNYRGSSSEIAKRFGVSYETVRKDVRGIYGKRPKRPTTEQLDFIRENHKFLTVKQMSKELDLGIQAIYYQLQSMNLKPKEPERESVPFKRPKAVYSNRNFLE